MTKKRRNRNQGLCNERNYVPGPPVHVQKIFVAVKQDCGRMLLDWLSVKDAPIQPEEIVDIAIQKVHRTSKV